MVREAQPGDKAQYLLMVRNFYEAGRFPFALDIVRQSAIFDIAMERDKFRLYLLDIEGKVRGYILAGRSMGPLTGEKVLQELMVWVEPDHRHHTDGHKGLLDAFIDLGEEWDVDRLGLCAQSSMRPKATGRLFRKFGFTETETHY